MNNGRELSFLQLIIRDDAKGKRVTAGSQHGFYAFHDIDPEFGVVSRRLCQEKDGSLDRKSVV